MKQYSTYRLTDGVIVAHLEAQSDAAIKANTPAGHALVEGHHDPKSVRIDTTTGKPVPYASPADPLAIKREARAAIARLEASQHRAVREALIGIAGAADRLKAIDEQIAAHRKDL
jgi:hypothetical protein